MLLWRKRRGGGGARGRGARRGGGGEWVGGVGIVFFFIEACPGGWCTGEIVRVDGGCEYKRGGGRAWRGRCVLGQFEAWRLVWDVFG